MFLVLLKSKKIVSRGRRKKLNSGLCFLQEPVKPKQTETNPDAVKREKQTG